MTQESIRLSLFLSRSGVSSRRKAEEIIQSGSVRVNGVIVKIPQTKVSSSDKITVGKRVIKQEEEKIYLALHKPKGFVCSNKPFAGQKSILKLLPEYRGKRLFTIGRLDKDTTGLILITNDGEFSQKVIHPSSKITKEYLVKTREEPTELHLKRLCDGMRIDGDFVRPVKVKKVRKGTFKIVVREGKKRQVRLMVKEAGLTLLELSRIRIGSLLLGPLSEGSSRLLTEQERKDLLQEGD